MPRIIDVTSGQTRKTNAIADGLQQSLNLALPLIDRLQRQNAERDRMARDDRDFSFRQQQADRQQGNTDRGFEFQTQQADRQQGNTDRAFDQRQQGLDRQFESEDAAAAFYRDQLMTMNPGPVGAGQFDGMDSETLRGIVETEKYAKQLDEARLRTESAAKTVLEEYGILVSSPQTAERLMAMIQNATTIEELNQAREAVWEVARQTEEMRADAVNREQTVLGTEPMRAGLATRPREQAAAKVLDRQFLAGELDFAKYWSEMGKVLEAAQGGGGERPTAERLAYAKGLDSIATRLASGDINEEEANALRSSLARMFGQTDGQAASSPASGGAASPVASAPTIPPKALQNAARFVAQKSDPQQREDAALDLAPKLLRDAGQPVNRETIAQAAMQILQAGGSNQPRTGDPMSGAIGGGMLSPANL